MNYLVIEEASEAVLSVQDNLAEAIEDAEGRPGKNLVVEDTYERKVVHDTMPGVTFKICDE
jgi:hypothetical protein